MIMEKIKTISVLGPTASGKTGLAIELAKRLDGEIVSCDSMQLYKEMSIGTAKPTGEEQNTVRHHLVDILEPDTEFSAADYSKLAAEAIDDIVYRGKTPILCGGTGLYHDCLMTISEFAENTADEERRTELYAIAEKNGTEALHAMLRAIDPEAAENIHPNNVKRVVRAIEIFETTGKRKSEVDREQTSVETRYDDTAFVIDFSDRSVLYSRIDRRVDMMIDEGLEEEARQILLSGNKISRTALQAIGYKEFMPYFNGEKTLAEVAEDIKLATHHYAKRQLIWFRRNPSFIHLIADEDGMYSGTDKLCGDAMDYLTKRGYK